MSNNNGKAHDQAHTDPNGSEKLILKIDERLTPFHNHIPSPLTFSLMEAANRTDARLNESDDEVHIEVPRYAETFIRISWTPSPNEYNAVFDIYQEQATIAEAYEDPERSKDQRAGLTYEQLIKMVDDKLGSTDSVAVIELNFLWIPPEENLDDDEIHERRYILALTELEYLNDLIEKDFMPDSDVVEDPRLGFSTPILTDWLITKIESGEALIEVKVPNEDGSYDTDWN